jgi:CheY-like chemotaxis protein
MIDPMSAAVLIVDDDAAFRGLARRMLSASGLDVVGEAESLATARAAATSMRPDALLVDVTLPDGNGFALARELATLPWKPRIVVTSSDQGAAIEHGFRGGDGIVAFVPKEDLPSTALAELLGGP